MGNYKGIAMDKSLDGLRMFQDNVLVLMDHIRDARKEETRGGIVVPQTAKKPGKAEAVLATVVLAGPGAWVGVNQDHVRAYRVPSRVFMPPVAQPGERILIDSASAGQPITIDGLEHRIIRQHNVIAVLEDGEESAAE